MEKDVEVHLSFLDIDIYCRNPDGFVGLSLNGSPPVPIVIYTSIHITTLQTNNQFWLLWYTEPELFVAKIPSLKNWNLSTCNTYHQDHRQTYLDCIYTLHPDIIRPTQQNAG
jgi:hypothetical protein